MIAYQSNIDILDLWNWKYHVQYHIGLSKGGTRFKLGGASVKLRMTEDEIEMTIFLRGWGVRRRNVGSHYVIHF